MFFLKSNVSIPVSCDPALLSFNGVQMFSRIRQWWVFNVPPGRGCKLQPCVSLLCFLVFILFIYLFREKGREGEREGETHRPGCLAHASNWESKALRDNAQPTEPHRTGLVLYCFNHYVKSKSLGTAALGSS